MTAELPPPSGPPQPNPDADAPPVQTADAPSPTGYPAPPPMMPPGAPAPWTVPAGIGLPPTGAMPSSGSLSFEPVPTPGTNGLAIAALCCGLVGIFPIAAIVAIVLGAVALNQLHSRIQRGRGMAVTGIVLGVLWLLGWVVLFVAAVVTSGPERTASGAVTQTTDAYVEDLEAGDCFSGAGRDEVDSVTILPCTSAHESQVVTIFAMPAGRWPGEDKVVQAAEKGCSEKADPLITDRAYDDLSPSFIYPTDEYSWRGSREIICVVDAPRGTTTGTALR
ncbi:DUF4190 domain-containing protein [Terrabacter sp. LjRoot27]|uniref:DUF4190 domain-containing protein n=1 Tax=Terrabacter sp. LjRoot27 TaxID=3342306 RepID=UPI003ECF103D